MSRLPRRISFQARLVFAIAASTLTLHAASTTQAGPAQSPVLPPVLVIDGLGKGVTPLAGPWQFHLGDNPSFAQPQTIDATGVDGWEALSPDATWGAQGHPAYTGYGWYRKHIHLTTAPGAGPDIAMMIRKIDDAYEIYWNGKLVGHSGTMPPDATHPWNPPPQTFGLGPIRDGVLALRVWKAPLYSFDPDTKGGLNFAPVIGSPSAIAAVKAQSDYTWLRSRQYIFGLESLYVLVALLGLLAWLRNRSQRVLLWLAVFCGGPCAAFLLTGLGIPFSYDFALGWLQPILSIEDIGLWFLLLYLLKLDENPRLYRFTCIIAVISIVSTSLDGLLGVTTWSGPAMTVFSQIADAILTVIFTVLEAYPLLLVGLSLRKKLDLSTWLLAIAAFIAEMFSVIRIALDQGSRFTHWTIGERLNNPLFTINGNVFIPRTITSSLLLLAIIYAAYRYVRDAIHRQGALEQEFKSARELQQVLIPEVLPELPGFAVTSAYRPAQEVGGDFFQIIPLEGEHAGSTMILLGDVSGKGLKAAMTVSLIVGAARTLAKFAPHPADLLSELNLRLFGRMQGGFTTCLAMRLSPDGHCTMASAGHPAPFLNQHELDLPGALPLGVMADTVYKEATFNLGEGDHFALYTDGLLEARSPSGEIFSFARLDALFSSRPNADQATQAAVDFGQDDDITVLTLTRLATGQRASTALSTPGFASA
jgi:hypothetical protein